MFKTFEEVQAKYPIGTKMNYSKDTMTQRYFYARPEDIVEYRKMYKTVEVISDEMVECTWDAEDFETVDGYIFDGCYWYPAEVTWDGWVPIREEEKDEGNSVV
jgi:hypothetical protein